jgi:hypothetical protein
MNRYANARELAADLEAVLHEHGDGDREALARSVAAVLS